ncbi:MAG: hypothetical protein P4N60_04450 [Verrucomicrobiae bacterium]|nr:hypothetical protein [Verrucomicrobiae bacterium]
MKILLGLLLGVAVILLSGCAAGITRTGYQLPPGKVSKDLPLEAVPIQANVQYSTNEVDVLGSIHAYDNGFSTDCDEATIIETFSREGHMLGADLIDITEETPPNPLTSTCYRARATFLRYKDREKAKGLVSDPQYAPGLIIERSTAATHRNNVVLGAALAGGVPGLIVADVATAPNHKPAATNSVPPPEVKKP